MNRITAQITITAIICIILTAIPAHAVQYPVIKVIDGDTTDVIYQGKKERVRLLAIDTPESVHPDQSRNTFMDRKASKYIKSRLTDKTVGLEFEQRKRGKYRRLLAYVILDGKNFNLELVREGWSPDYTKYGKSENHHADFVAAEKKALAKPSNIWAAKTKTPDISKETLQCKMVRSNVKSMVFHRPGCHYKDLYFLSRNDNKET